MSNLEEWAFIMHKDIEMQDYKNGWFGKHTMCCRGEQILKWLSEKICSSQKTVRLICNKMLDQGLL